MNASMNMLTLQQQVTAKLRDLIVEGVLAPNTKLNERLLTEDLEVSRTPLREAIRTLAAEGLVELQPNRGAVVARLNAEQIAHAFEVLGALEGLNGELACERITEEELNEIRALHFEMLAHYTRGDLSGYYHLNKQIHDAISAAARNPILADTYHHLNRRLQAIRFRSNFNRDKWDAAVRDHIEMLDALASRDGVAMRTILIRHLANKRDAVLGTLDAANAQNNEAVVDSVSQGD